MALTYVETYTTQAGSTGGDITSSSFSVAVDDWVTVMFATEDNAGAGTLSISNTGTAISWGSPFAITATDGNCKVAAWKGKATAAESITVTVLGNGVATVASAISCVVHTGAHQTDTVPSGNIFSGVGANDASQSITPTATGSCLWMVLGDWTASNALGPNGNCTTESSVSTGGYSTAIIRPTTQPRTDAAAFTIGEASDGDATETTAWIAFEVQAAPESKQYARPSADVTDGAWISNTNTAVDLYLFMDETPAADTDFIETGTSTTGLWAMSPITSVGAGTVIFRYRATGDASSNLVAYVGVGTAAGAFSAVGSWTEVAVATAIATFAHTVTGTFSDYTKLQFKLEST